MIPTPPPTTTLNLQLVTLNHTSSSIPIRRSRDPDVSVERRSPKPQTS